MQTQETIDGQDATGTGYWNLPTPTLGGKQFWTDWVHFHGYRIQQNASTGHFRLIDPANVRRAWGDLQHCEARLDKIRQRENLPLMTGNVVILLHGLSRTRSSLGQLVECIEENSDLVVLNVSYASTRDSVADHAKALDHIIRHLPEVDEISFVTHSLGAVVVRYYLGAYRDGAQAKEPRFARMVMLGPPNNRSRLAEFLQNNFVFKTICGASGQELARRWEEIEQTLATPDFEFGIVAGAQPEGAWLNNFLIPGKDDFIVGVEETKLAGAADFVVLPLLHGTMMNNAEAQQATVSFLKNGFFVSTEQKQSLPSSQTRAASTDASGDVVDR